MILNKEVTMYINMRNITYYRKKGYILKIGDYVNIKIEDLIIGSPILVDTACDICGKEKKMRFKTYNINIIDDGLYYCTKCKSIKIKKSKKERYGDENYNNHNKYVETSIEKYGVNHPAKTQEHINKIKKGKKEKYGDENYNNVEKCKITKNERYGDENYNNYNKYVKTSIEKYGVDNISKLQSNKLKTKNTRRNKIIEKYEKYNIIDIDYDNYEFIYQCNGHISNIPKNIFYNRLKSKSTLCTVCNPVNSNISDCEISLLNFIKNNYDDEIVTNSKLIISPYEIDIYLPKLKLAFEFNGIYWHNELNRPNNYHKLKNDLCEKKGINLLHIYEDDWKNKEDLIKSLIINNLKKNNKTILSENCEIKEINDNILIKNFLKENHIKGYIGSKIKIGLFYKNELISVMIFGNIRKHKNINNNYELLRFCNKKYINVIDSEKKLFNYFVKKYIPTEIITYIDRGYFNIDLYKNINFKIDTKISPDFYYIKNEIREHRNKFNKNILYKYGFDINKTEHEIMLERKIYKIYNSGNYIFEYN